MATDRRSLATGQPAVPAVVAPSVKPSLSSSPSAGAGTSAPFGISEEVFEAGARVYNQQRCAGCHGRPGRNGSAGAAEQFWSAAQRSDHAAATLHEGEIYQQIAAGSPDRGMPAYQHSLSDTELWDLSLLLKNSRGDLPDPVLRILHGSR